MEYKAFFAMYDKVYSSCKAQMVSFKVDFAPTIVLPKFSKFIDVFSRQN